MPDLDPSSNSDDSAPTEPAWCPPTLEELGELLPQFRIDELLGLGGMGAVYKAYQANLGRFVAIKLLSADYSSDESFIVTFKNEARILAQLHHPRIIAIHDLGETSEGHLYFVMEYIEGVNLRRILAEGPLPQDRALMIVGQICDALHAAHEKGIVHRDVKPENILIDAAGNVKLVDFGLAAPPRDAEDGPSGGVIMGTPDYTAPEVLEDQADHRADLFALGVMLYEMLTCRVPKGEYAPASEWANCDPRIDRVIARAVQPDRETRYQRAIDFKTMVDHISEGPEVVAVPRGVVGGRPLAVAVEPKRSNNLAAIVVGAALLLGAGVFFMGGKKVEPSTAEPPQVATTDSTAKPVDPPSLNPTTTPTTDPAPDPSVKERKTIARFEGEAMTVGTVSGGETEIQSLKDRRSAVWSGDAQLRWIKGNKGDVMTAKFLVFEGGRQRVRAVLTAGRECAIVAVKCDGKAVAGSPFNQHSNHLTNYGAYDFGVFDLAQGEHELEFKFVDSHSEAVLKGAGYDFGIDYLQFEPASRTEPPVEEGTDVAPKARVTASRCEGKDYVQFINTERDMAEIRSDSEEFTRMTWHPSEGNAEWAQYDWDLPQVIGECQIYWYVFGRCAVPKHWRILYRDESGVWMPVDAEFTDAAINEWSNVKFPPVRTTALRVWIQCENKRSAGIWSWKALAAAPASVVAPKTKPRNDLFLGDISPLHSQVSHGSFSTNVYQDDDKGKRVPMLGGKESTQFLWVHPPSRVEYAIPSGYDRFKATGIPPALRSGEALLEVGALKLRVEVDGKMMFESDELKTYPNMEMPVDIKFPVGSKRLIITTDNLGDGHWDHFFLANATLLVGEGTGKSVVTPAAPRPSPPPAPPTPPAPTGMASVANSRWSTTTEANQRAWGDLIFRTKEFSTMNGIAGQWKSTGPLTVELGTMYVLEFTEDMTGFIATLKDGTRVATGKRKEAAAETEMFTGAGFKPIYETSFEAPIFVPGAFQAGRIQTVSRTDLRWTLFNAGRNPIELFTTGIQAQFFKAGKQAVWVNAKAANTNRVGVTAFVESPGGATLVSADVYLATSARKSRWQFAIGDPEAASGFVAGFNIDASGSGIQLFTKGGTVINEPIKRDAWMRIQVLVSPDDQSFDVYIDGKSIAPNTPMFDTAKRVRTFQFATAGDGDDRAFLDNFSFSVRE